MAHQLDVSCFFANLMNKSSVIYQIIVEDRRIYITIAMERLKILLQGWFLYPTNVGC